MYNPRWFKEERIEVLQEKVNEIGFGTLVTKGAHTIYATHLPMILEEGYGTKGRLVGHIAKGNQQWRDYEKESEGLAIFMGPDAYISPTWYETKKETGEVVPTWNYITVHVRGKLRFFEDRERLRNIVTSLTELHESGSEKPWKVSEAPSSYIEKELKLIVGLEMEISGFEGKWKLSQNRTEVDRKGVVSGLRKRGEGNDVAVSEEMNMKTGSEGPAPGKRIE